MLLMSSCCPQLSYLHLNNIVAKMCPYIVGNFTGEGVLSSTCIGESNGRRVLVKRIPV